MIPLGATGQLENVAVLISDYCILMGMDPLNDPENDVCLCQCQCLLMGMSGVSSGNMGVSGGIGGCLRGVGG